MRKTRTTYVPVNTEDANAGNPLYYKKYSTIRPAGCTIFPCLEFMN